MEGSLRCFRCKKPIIKDENYYHILEFDKEKAIDESFVHRTCWDEFLKGVSNVEESMGIIRGLKKWLITHKVLPEEEYIVA